MGPLLYFIDTLLYGAFFAFQFIYFSIVDGVTRIFPVPEFRHFQTEQVISEENKAALFKKLKKNRFRRITEEDAEEAAFQRKWWGRHLSIQCTPIGPRQKGLLTPAKFRISLEVTTPKRFWPVFPLVSRDRKKYRFWLERLVSWSGQKGRLGKFVHASGTPNLHDTFRGAYLFSFLAVGAGVMLLGFLFQPVNESHWIFDYMISGNHAKKEIYTGFYFDLMKNHPQIWLPVNTVLSALALSVWTLFSTYWKPTQPIPRMLGLAWKFRKPLFVLCGTVTCGFFWYIDASQNQLKQMEEKFRNSSWFVNATGKVLSSEVLDFNGKWENAFRRQHVFTPHSLDEWDVLLVKNARIDDFEEFVHDFRTAVSGSILHERATEIPSISRHHPMEGWKKSNLLLEKYSPLLLAQGLKEVRSNNGVQGAAIWQAVLKIQQALLCYPKVHAVNAVQLECMLNQILSRTLIGRPEVELLRFGDLFRREGLSSETLLQFEITDHLMEFFSFPFYRAYYAMEMLPRTLVSTIIQDRILHTYISISSGHRQSPFSPFALDVMDAIGLPYHQRKMDQYWELQAYAKGLLPLPTMEPPLSKNLNFSTFSQEFYDYEFFTHFYSFLLDNRTIMRTAHAAAKYRRQYGGLPETMEALVPEFLSEIPKSVRNEEPIQYLLSPQLLSLGWPPTKGDYESATWMKLDRRLPPYPLATAFPDLPREEGSPFGPRFW